MSEKTNISWCHSTWSPWLGCRKVSPGCANCYITTTTPFRTRKLKHGEPRQRTSENYWKQPVKWDKAHRAWRDQPCDPKFRPAVDGHPNPRIFPSLCDWLDDEVPIEWLADFLKLIHDTQDLDWLLLTKRPENFLERTNLASAKLLLGAAGGDHITGEWVVEWLRGEPPKNVWAGVSVEDQRRADERIPLLLKIPAKVRFLSVEPLLEKVDLKLHSRVFNFPRHIGPSGDAIYDSKDLPWQWTIVGGESGPNRRDCGVEAICDVARQCQAAGVPCFVKQSSALRPGQQMGIPDEIWKLKQFPK